MREEAEEEFEGGDVAHTTHVVHDSLGVPAARRHEGQQTTVRGKVLQGHQATHHALQHRVGPQGQGQEKLLQDVIGNDG